MNLSVGHKLFLTLLLATGLVIVGMVVFMTWSFERGFIRFIEARQQERVEALVERLADYYRETGSWEELRADRARWVELLIDSYRKEQRISPRIRQLLRELDQQSDSTEGKTGGRYRHQPVERRLLLLDTDHSAIIGHVENLEDINLTPIQVNQTAVGYLGVRAGPTLERIGEVRFLEQQISNFIWIALAAVLLSAFLAILLAKGLVQPVKQFTTASRALAAGRYDARIPVHSGDELGQLARDFNSLAAALERTEQQRRQWVADTSHELRTPLAVLRGELEAIQDGMRTLDQAAIDSLHAEVMRLNRLVDDLYELSMSDLGSLSYRATATDPVAILQEVIEHYSVEFDAGNVRIELHVEPGVPATIQADPDRLAQLFRNLLNNSLRYTDGDGKLQIRMHATADALHLDFDDTAPGVLEDQLPQLFDRFYRVEDSRNRSHGGAGLGLAICRNIVTAHGGTITAQASPLGGVRIHIELPIT